jgi:GDPmannose 4,6-dehydratase
MNQSKALITGITGQDGALLAKLLVNQGKSVFGTFRKTSSGNFWRLEELGLLGNINLIEYQIGQGQDLMELIQKNKFEHIYHLAGDSMTSDSLIHPYQTMNTNVQGLLEVLESVRKGSADSKVFVAASSEVFDNANLSDANGFRVKEGDKKGPRNPYGVSSLSNMALVEVYRKQFGLQISCGILFNHESAYRGDAFITKKITKGLSKIKFNSSPPLMIGAFGSSRDWGSAEDYVKAMNLMLEGNLFDDYILATGKLHTVRDILEIASGAFGFKTKFEGTGVNEVLVEVDSGKVLARIDEKFIRKFDNSFISGDSSKFQKVSGWRNEISFNELILTMSRFEIDNRKTF